MVHSGGSQQVADNPSDEKQQGPHHPSRTAPAASATPLMPAPAADAAPAIAVTSTTAVTSATASAAVVAGTLFTAIFFLFLFHDLIPPACLKTDPSEGRPPCYVAQDGSPLQVRNGSAGMETPKPEEEAGPDLRKPPGPHRVEADFPPERTSNRPPSFNGASDPSFRCAALPPARAKPGIFIGTSLTPERYRSRSGFRMVGLGFLLTFFHPVFFRRKARKPAQGLSSPSLKAEYSWKAPGTGLGRRTWRADALRRFSAVASLRRAGPAVPSPPGIRWASNPSFS
jgi:hypothetical protein